MLIEMRTISVFRIFLFYKLQFFHLKLQPLSTRMTKISHKLLQLPSHSRFIKNSFKITPPEESKNKNKFLSITNAHSLKAAIFYTMAFIILLEIDNEKVIDPTERSFFKVLHNVRKIKKKQINFEQYTHLHLDDPKIAICETVSDTVFILNASFTTKDNYFRVAIDEACFASNKVMLGSR